MNKALSFFAVGFLTAAGMSALLSFRSVGPANPGYATDDEAWTTKLNTLQNDLGEFSLVEKEGMLVLIANNGGRYRIVRARDGWVELGRKDVASDTYWAPAGRVIIKRR